MRRARGVEVDRDRELASIQEILIGNATLRLDSLALAIPSADPYAGLRARSARP